MKHGFGTYKWASGQVFTGEWYDNEKVSGETFDLVPPHLTSDQHIPPPPATPAPYLKSFIASQTRPNPSSSSSSNTARSPPTSMHPIGHESISSTAVNVPNHRSSTNRILPPPPTPTTPATTTPGSTTPTTTAGATAGSTTAAGARHVVTPGPSIVYKNRAGFRMEHGRSDCSHKLYCGRRMGADNIPGSNGVCGPYNGPQCADCVGITNSNEHTFISTTNGSARKTDERIPDGRDAVMEDEDDSDIREAIRRSLSECRPVLKVFVNRAGYRMCLGEDSGCTHLFYCSRWMGVDKIPGSDGQCGPNNGPQCSDCRGAETNNSHRYLSPDGTAKSAEYWMAEEGDGNDLILMEAIRRSQLDMQGENMVIATDGPEDASNIVSSSNSTTNSTDNVVEMAYSTPSKLPPFPPQFINTTTDITTPVGNASSKRPPTWFTVTPVQTQTPSSFTPVYRLAPPQQQQPQQQQQQQSQSNPMPIRIPTEESPVCVVCMVQPRTMAFAPCGHLCICDGCYHDLKMNKRLQHCVLCQSQSNSCLRIFN